MTPAERAGRPRKPYAPRMAPEQRREQLLDAALGVIVKQGYERVSVEAIARAAGVTRPVVYDHFENLGRLLQALIQREERYSVQQLAAALPASPEQLHPVVVLAGSFRRFLDAVASRPDTWTLILLPLQGTPEIVRRHVESNRATVLAQMETVVKWGLAQTGTAQHGTAQTGTAQHGTVQDRAAQSDGESIDIELAARAILGLAEDAGRMVLTNPHRYSPERYEQFIERVTKLLWPS